MSRTVQVPYPIVQSEMFLPTVNPVSPYRREWVNRLGDVCVLEATRTPNHYDLMNFLVFLHVVQNNRDIDKTVLDSDRYKIIMPLSYMYEILGFSLTSQRREMWDSLKRLSKTSLEIRYKRPDHHNGASEIVFSGLTGDLKLIRQRGRQGHLVEAKPLQALVDDRMLTADIDRMLALRSPLARILAFYVTARRESCLTWNEWMHTVSTGRSLRHFKTRFTAALKEMETQGYSVEVRSDCVKLGRRTRAFNSTFKGK